MAPLTLYANQKKTPDVLLSKSFKITRKQDWPSSLVFTNGHLKNCFSFTRDRKHETTDLRISYDQLHKLYARATPVQMMNYKHSLLLYKLYNDTKQTDDWDELNWNQSFNSRSTKVRLFDVSSKKIGRNLLSNRLTLFNNQIEYDWLNKSWNSYKLICKNLFFKLTYPFNKHALKSYWDNDYFLIVNLFTLK